MQGIQYEELLCGSQGKESACSVGDLDLIPGFGRSLGEGNGNPLQYSCLDNSMNRGAWQATVYGVSQGVGHNWATYIYIYAVWGCYCPWTWDTIHLTMTRDTYLTATICLPVLHIRVGDGQGGLVCCDSWGLGESDTTERLNWTELAYQVGKSIHQMQQVFLN